MARALTRNLMAKAAAKGNPHLPAVGQRIANNRPCHVVKDAMAVNQVEEMAMHGMGVPVAVRTFQARTSTPARASPDLTSGATVTLIMNKVLEWASMIPVALVKELHLSAAGRVVASAAV